MKHQYFVLLIIGIIFLSGCTANKESEPQVTGKVVDPTKPKGTMKCEGTFEGTIEHVVDGDTLKIKDCDKNIRLPLVDTPEVDEPGYQEAKSFTEDLCKVGITATINQDDKQPSDRYGRIIALVYCQNKNLNVELISNKLGTIDTRFCFSSEFSNEEWAKDCQLNATGVACHPSYPTVCIPSSPPDLDCRDIPYKNFEVIPPDPHRFDGDGDGIGCESLIS